MKSSWIACAVFVLAVRGYSQAAKPLGTVSAADATVSAQSSGVIKVVGGRSVLAGSATVTAKVGRNADVAVARGGSVLVCQSTVLHITPSNDDSLLLAMDRGAMEIRMKAGFGDVVMTPDLRFTMAAAGPLDLQMRVTFNGDTCVENRGRKAPQLNISDAFGETNYLLKPGQHVMFEHGSLRMVEDRETTPCGCPPEEKLPAGASVADALLRGGQSTLATPQQAEAAHPFPTAVSDGLAQPDAGTPETSGERHVQVASTLTFDPNKSVDPNAGIDTPVPVPPPPIKTPPAPQKSGPLNAVGRFFKRIFVR